MVRMSKFGYANYSLPVATKEKEETLANTSRNEPKEAIAKHRRQCKHHRRHRRIPQQARGNHKKQHHKKRHKKVTRRGHKTRHRFRQDTA